MRLYEFDNEEEVGKKIADFILENCQQWLRDSGDGEFVVYRGVKGMTGKQYFTKPIRQDRRPLDSSEVQHRFYQMLLNMAGATANRENSAFVTTDEHTAQQYGHPFVFIPVGDFDYTFLHPQLHITDWYSSPRELVMSFIKDEYVELWNDAPDSDSGFVELFKIGPDAIDKGTLRYIISNQHLEKAYDTEIMIWADKGLYIDQHIYNEQVMPIIFLR